MTSEKANFNAKITRSEALLVSMAKEVEDLETDHEARTQLLGMQEERDNLLKQVQELEKKLQMRNALNAAPPQEEETDTGASALLATAKDELKCVTARLQAQSVTIEALQQGMPETVHILQAEVEEAKEETFLLNQGR